MDRKGESEKSKKAKWIKREEGRIGRAENWIEGKKSWIREKIK